MACPRSPTVDLAILQEVHEIMDGDDGAEFRELIQTYLANATEYLAALAQALAEGNIRAIQRTAHSLKGSSGNLGPARFSALAPRSNAWPARTIWPKPRRSWRN
jgi:HPt (histidine-containing phosphotransfer) domain-containing protein